MGGNVAVASAGLPYRPDIDGLRGIAVLLVMAFHFNIPPISGGYIGVDIFFVISGFLITSLLCRESATLSALNSFYRRRIKRLLPMFVVFSAVSTIAAVVLLLPEDLLRYIRSLYYSLIFQANTHFDLQTKNYFAPNSRELPLLHVWSLSIEWQFYLIFPALFLLARKWLSPHRLMVGIAFATGVLAVNSWHETGSTQQAYFYTSARFFELLIGCFTALIKVEPRSAFHRSMVVFAIVLLLGIAALFDSNTSFPGIHALQVCLLTAIVILFGAGNRVLELPALVHVGRISYSAYLWHWPIAAYFSYLQTPISPVMGVALIALVLALAHLSYVSIEQPGRQIQLPLWGLICCFVFLPTIAVISLYKVASNHDGFYGRLGAESVHIYSRIQPYLDNTKLRCMRVKSEERHECRFGEIDSGSTVYLIGDSHAGHYQWFVDVMASDARLSVVSLTHNECLVIPGAANLFKGPEHAAHCENAVKKDFERIKMARPKYVLIAQRWAGYSYDEVKKLDGAIAMLLSAGITPVILGPVAENGEDLKACFYQHIKLRRQYKGECTFAQDNYYNGTSKNKIAGLFAEIRQKYPQAILINVQDVQCERGNCKAEIAGIPIYDDTHHINGYGSSTLARIYIERFGNPLNTRPAVDSRRIADSPKT